MHLFQSCALDDTVWGDHSTLTATFRGGKANLVRFPWPQPVQIPWSKLPNRPLGRVHDFDGSSDCTATYQEFWMEVEQGAAEIASSSGVSLPSKAFGRGRRVAPKVDCAQSGPVKSGRHGEFQPQFLDYSAMYAKWVKQLRRLQSYVRIAQVVGPSPTHVEHQVALWTSILRAPGFSSSFQSWWPNRTVQGKGPCQIPSFPPISLVAVTILEVFLEEVRDLEKALKKHARYEARLRRGNDFASLFRQVRREPPSQVEVLHNTVCGTICNVDLDTWAIEFAEPIGWTEHHPFVHQGLDFKPLVVTADKLWVDDVHRFAIGDRVVQNHPQGSLQELFRAFEEQWTQRWGKHASLTSSHWQVILDFARCRLGQIQMPSLELTVPLVRAAIRSKKRNAARGLDGVTRDDLLALDSNQLQSAVNLFTFAQKTGCWPQQLLCGRVQSLAKCLDPHTVNDFRPVTIFSLLYRVWSSLQSKYWLSALDPILHFGLLGNRQGKRAGHLWRLLIEQLESSYVDGTPLHGIVFDLTKAFNTLPRIPVQGIATCVGIDFGVIKAWSGALANFRRFFHVRGSFSPGVLSTCGYPEGCGLSCLAMLLLDQCYHEWLRACEGSPLSLTYVDNWEVILHDHSKIDDAFRATMSFAESLDLTIDAQKTFFWSTCAFCRREFRRQGKKVSLANRDLGAHVVYGRQIANQTTLVRFQELDDFWRKLKAANGTHTQKLALVRQVAWPRAFHACSAVVVGKKHVGSLRTRVLQSLGLDKPGASPILQLACESFGSDPGVHLIIDTLRDFRDLGAGCEQVSRLHEVAQGSVFGSFGSVHEILCQRLHQLGWEHVVDSTFQDDWGPFDIVAVNFADLCCRVSVAWRKVVAQQVGHRESFASFQEVDCVVTGKDVCRRDSLAQGVLWRTLNGSQFCNQETFHWSADGSLSCVECGACDSAYHRYWVCPSTADLRAQLDSEVVGVIPDLPVVASVHGWTLAPSTETAWAQYLLTLPPLTVPSTFPSVGPVWDLFVDGSCFWPEHEAFRVAAWSVVVAHPLHLDPNPGACQVLQAQPVVGLSQTAYRAELTALVAALTFVAQSPRWVRIWSDCEAVVNKFHLLTSGKVSVKVNGKHSDLWLEVVRLVEVIDLKHIRVIKVPAHEDITTATTSFDEWICVANSVADRAAKAANRNRVGNFWTLWEHHVGQSLKMRFLGVQIRDHIAAVNMRWVSRFKDREPSVVLPVRREPRAVRSPPML